MRSTRLPSWIERLAGLESEHAPPHVFSLREGSLRYGRVDRSEDGSISIGQFQGVSLPEGAFQPGPLGGPLTEPRLLREPLDELLGQLDAAVEAASLVLPDRWLRLVLANASDLPRKRSARDEAILFKLRNLVPFRVEELRVRSEVIGGGSGRRALIGFAIDHLLGQLEIQFAAAGVSIGRITSESLGLSSALGHARRVQPIDGLSAQILAQPDGYTLLFFSDGEPLLYRYKVTDPHAAVEVAGQLARRELTLTLRYLEQQMPELTLNRAWVAAAGDSADHWYEQLSRSLGVEPVVVGAEHLPGGDSVASPWSMPWHEMAPMIGAALEEVT